MAIRAIIIFVFGFSVLWAFGYSSNIQCSYGTFFYTPVGSVYRCELKNNINITSKDSRVISSNSGSHESGKSNADVTCFYTDGSTTMRYFPRNLENIFENLKMIYINRGRLQEIQQSDLRPFLKLVYLDLDYNDIEFLDDGLFAYNPELELIRFGYNKIIHIGSQVFDHLKKLNYLFLESNKCIDMRADNSLSAVKEVINYAKAKCKDYDEIAKELKTLETSLLCVNSETFPIFDQNLQNLQNQFQTSKFSNSPSLKERFQKITNWKSKNIWTVTNSTSEVLSQIGSLKTDLTAIKDTQTSTDSKVSNLNKLTNSQAQTCSAISNDVANVSNYLISMNQVLPKKSDNTEIKNSIRNITSQISSIESKMNAKFSNLSSYLVGNHATITSSSDKINEVKVLQQGIQQKSTTIEKSLKNIQIILASSTITDTITKIGSSLNEIIIQKSDSLQRSITVIKTELKGHILAMKINMTSSLQNSNEEMQKASQNITQTLNQINQSQIEGTTSIIKNILKIDTSIVKLDREISTKSENIKNDIKMMNQTHCLAYTELQKRITKSVDDIKTASSLKLEKIAGHLNVSHANIKNILKNVNESQQLMHQNSNDLNEGIKLLNQSQSQVYSSLADNILNLSSNFMSSMSSVSQNIQNSNEQAQTAAESVKQKIEDKLVALQTSILNSLVNQSSDFLQKVHFIDKTVKNSSQSMENNLKILEFGLNATLIHLQVDMNHKSSALNESLMEVIIRSTQNLDNRITNLVTNLNIALTGNITNDVNSRTINMNERITEIETAMSGEIISIKDQFTLQMSAMSDKMSMTESNMTELINDLSLKGEDSASIINSKLVNIETAMRSKASDLDASMTKNLNNINDRITKMETAANTKITSLDEKMSNLTLMLQDFIQLSTESSNKIGKTSKIHDYSKSIMIGCCGLLNIILIIIIYREMFSQPDE